MVLREVMRKHIICSLIRLLLILLLRTTSERFIYQKAWVAWSIPKPLYTRTHDICIYYVYRCRRK